MVVTKDQNKRGVPFRGFWSLLLSIHLLWACSFPGPVGSAQTHFSLCTSSGTLNSQLSVCNSHICAAKFFPSTGIFKYHSLCLGNPFTLRNNLSLYFLSNVWHLQNAEPLPCLGELPAIWREVFPLLASFPYFFAIHTHIFQYGICLFLFPQKIINWVHGWTGRCAPSMNNNFSIWEWVKCAPPLFPHPRTLVLPMVKCNMYDRLGRIAAHSGEGPVTLWLFLLWRNMDSQQAHLWMTFCKWT